MVSASSLLPQRYRLAAWIAFLLAPALAIVIVFIVMPIVSALTAAFYDWEGLARGEFTGLENFRDVLFEFPFAGTTWRAFGHNVYIFALLLVVQNGGGFFLAWLLYREPFGHRFHRVAVFLPVVLSTVIVGFLWKLFLNPNFGLVNQTLNMVGLQSLALPWLGLSSTALTTLALVSAWHYVGFPTLIYLAGMQRIPREIIESARLDGAGEWHVIRRIVWPLVAPSTTVTFTLLFIGAFNWFELPYIMAGLDGSPFGSTDVLGLYFYRTAFGNQSAGVTDFGHGNALAALMFIFLAVVAALITILLRRREIEL
jgi:raffinose/stachyose/melibiose transport system permease protein